MTNDPTQIFPQRPRSQPRPVIGLLYAGEMGTAIGMQLQSTGCRVVTTASLRSPATQARIAIAGFQTCNTLAQVITTADIVFSVVPPAAAWDVAQQVAFFTPDASTHDRIYVDCNSIAATEIRGIAERLQSRHWRVVDASIHGQARSLAESATLYLSGPQADQITPLFGSAVRTRIAGPALGDASEMKMLLGGVSKGLCALATELGVLAERLGKLDLFCDEVSRFYPQLMTAIERMLPTYPSHATRRADEMLQLIWTSIQAGQSPLVVQSVERLIRSLGRIPHDRSAEWTVQSIVCNSIQHGLLAHTPHELAAQHLLEGAEL
ncbi:MAG: NAD(P)-binding domain-containing protein [Tepidisphaeraceae bacterium]